MIKARIVSDPKILGGKPIIAGTRISVELIMNFLAAGMSVDEILKEYPELKKTEVLVAIEYAAKLVSKQRQNLAPLVGIEPTSLVPKTRALSVKL